MKKFPVAAGIALALVAGSAIAADLPSMKAPPAYIPPPPPMSWNGLYGGVNIGYGFGQNVTEAGSYNYVGFPAIGGSWLGSNSMNGVLGGGQIGYNWQFSPWLVLGFETDIQAADLGGTRDYFGPATLGFTAVNSSLNVDWFGTARGRVGFVMPSWPNLMVYGTGGFAYGGLVQQSSISNVNVLGAGTMVNGKSTHDTTATGWTAGGGVEWMPLPSWSVKVEYLYTDLGNYTQSFVGVNNIGGVAPPMVGANTGSARWHTVRAGLNWHFNPFASAPILAKY